MLIRYEVKNYSINGKNVSLNNLPSNMVEAKRFIYNVVYFYKKFNPKINKKVIQYISSKGIEIANPDKSLEEIVIFNHSITRQKHPDNGFDEEKIESNMYFGKAFKLDYRTHVNDVTNLSMSDIIYIEDFHFNLIFNAYGKRYFENYSRSNHFDTHNAFRTMADREIKFICPGPHYYTFEHQQMGDKTSISMTEFMENVKDEPVFNFYHAGELRTLMDAYTTVLKLNIELDDILSNSNILKDQHHRALILENIVYVISLIKVHIEMCGFSSINLIFDSHRGFNVKEIKAKIKLDPQLLQKQYAVLLEYIDNIYQENFQGLVAELALKFGLFMYIDPVSTKIQLILDKSNLGTTGLNQQEIVENMMSM